MFEFDTDYKPQSTEELKQLRAAADGAPGSFFVFLLLQRWGAEAIGWDTDTITAELKQMGLTPTKTQFDAIFGLITALSTDVFTTDVAAFIHICNAVGGHSADFEVFDPATLEEIALTLAEIRLFDDEPLEFAPDIFGYISAEAQFEGLSVYPPALTELAGTESPNPYASIEAAGDPVILQTVAFTQQAKSQEIQDEVERRMLGLAERFAKLNLDGKPHEYIWKSFPKKQA